MAFTLESALVIPVSIGILTASVSMALPAYKEVQRTAALGAAASVCSTENKHLYKTFRVILNGESSMDLETSPSMLIDLCELAADLYQSISSLVLEEPKLQVVISDLFSDDSTLTEQPETIRKRYLQKC